MPQLIDRTPFVFGCVPFRFEERGSGRIKRYYVSHPSAIGASNPIFVTHEIYLADGSKALADMMLPFYGIGVMQRLLSAKVPGSILGNVVRDEGLAPAPF